MFLSFVPFRFGFSILEGGPKRMERAVAAAEKKPSKWLYWSVITIEVDNLCTNYQIYLLIKLKN